MDGTTTTRTTDTFGMEAQACVKRTAQHSQPPLHVTIKQYNAEDQTSHQAWTGPLEAEQEICTATADGMGSQEHANQKQDGASTCGDQEAEKHSKENSAKQLIFQAGAVRAGKTATGQET